MPKIAAATVAEHRARQRAALLRAAEATLAEGGYGALGFAGVAERAGLARSTVYEYFTSKEDLFAAVCEESLPRWLTPLSQAVSAARTPRTRLVTYVRTHLEMIADGRHRLAHVLASAPLSGDTRARIRAVHDRLAPDLDRVLAQLGHAEPARVAGYVQSILNEATRQLHAGADPAGVIRAAVAFVLDGAGGGRYRLNRPPAAPTHA